MSKTNFINNKIRRKMKNLIAFFILFEITIGSCQVFNITICEGSSKVITCPKNSIIKIESAMYGCLSVHKCLNNSESNLVFLKSSNIAYIIQELCDGNISCFIQSNNNSSGGDPCPGILKHMFIKYMCSLEAECDAFLQEKDTLIKNGSLVAVLKSINKEYSVSFEINPTEFFLTNYTSVIHLTTGNNTLNYGSRNPAVFFLKNGNGSVHVCSALNSSINVCKNTSPIHLGIWSSIKISQNLFQAKYIYSIQLNNKSILNVENTDARTFLNVSVYISDPWYIAQPGLIRKVVIKNEYSVSWVQWSPWSVCNNSLGIINRSRKCNISNTMKWCCGENYEEKQCFNFWTQWSSWSHCNDSFGFIHRKRDCNVSNYLDWCYGNNSEVMECFAFWSQWSNWSICNGTYGFTNRIRECNVSNAGDRCQAFWTQWSTWSNCNDSFGFMNRTRACNASNAMEWCLGNNLELVECFVFWTQWNDWSSCNGSYGFTNRTRGCNASNHIDKCFGKTCEVMECFVFWTQWSSWTSCNSSHEFMNRTRECLVSNTSNWCDGEMLEIRECFEMWSSWSECSVSCGRGNKTSYSLKGKERVESCGTYNCPVDGMWGNWKNLDCSKTCGSGIKTFSRTCNSPYPAYGGQNCMGTSNYTEDCHSDVICPVNGYWSAWSPWSLCSQQCDGGAIIRFRSCTNPKPSYRGLPCYGSSSDTFNCSSKICTLVNMNLVIFFTDENYTEQYSDLTSDPSIDLKKRIQKAISNFYSQYKKNGGFIITLNFMRNDDGSNH
ncbi:A disintegrin and metalloproteinase with thrombospondin motifs adt-1 isoform X3 [Hydra vulgaris]|uniref:A disintegrin and metalloproteinase with thrombospondin motifs adt-1 isoform X3 n=1 Tax=Hydra vulgaris TaxID=6087 RepID=UPI0032E9C525